MDDNIIHDQRKALREKRARLTSIRFAHKLNELKSNEETALQQRAPINRLLGNKNSRWRGS